MRIVIVGAGLSGLTLAAAVHAMSPDAEIEIYERDDSWVTGRSPADPEPLIVARGGKAVLASRRAAEQFHTTSGFSRSMRNLGFRSADAFMSLGRRFARKN